MSKDCLKVLPSVTIREVMQLMQENHQNCVLVVTFDELLDGIITLGDIKRHLSKLSGSPISGGSSFVDVRAWYTIIQIKLLH